MKTDFWSLLDDYTIRIPIIQRDYAQGRSHPKIDSIREQFIGNLLTHLQEPTAHLELDFIYGAQQENALIILDGQQRLTTLFLLHFYLAANTSQFNDKMILAKFAKFQYETRQSSRDFLEALLENALICQQKQHQDNIANRIKNEQWYYAIWNHDPTVQSLLNVFNEIEKQIQAFSLHLDQLWRNLTEKKTIYFYFLEMENFGLTDELYIKMNARGIHLTEFENFKAWLNTQISADFSPLFFQRMDKEWTDLFWSLRPKHAQDIDDIFYECFKVIGSAILALEKRHDIRVQLAPLSQREELIELLRHKDKPYVDLMVYQNHHIFSEQICRNIFLYLNLLCQIKQQPRLFNLIEQAFLSHKDQRLFSQSYQGYLLAYVVYLYATHAPQQDQFNLDEFRDYFKICERLIYNQYYDNIDDYIQSVNLLTDWTCQLDLSNVVKSVASLDESRLSQKMNFRQYKEEKDKANLIVQQGWNKSVLDHYADHYGLYGKIDFLIKWSQGQDNIPNETKFKHYAEKLTKTFDVVMEAQRQDLLQRTLLCYGNYLHRVSSKLTFCVMSEKHDARAHNENWRGVFNKTDHNYFKQLLDDLQVEQPSIQDLEKNLLDKKSLVKDWRRLCIENANVIAYCGTEKFIDFQQEQHIYLIAGKKKIRYVELRSYSLYLALKDLNTDNVNYKDSLQPVVRLSVEYQGQDQTIYIRYNSVKKDFNYYVIEDFENPQNYELKHWKNLKTVDGYESVCSEIEKILDQTNLIETKNAHH